MTQPKRWLVPPKITAEADAALAAFPPILRQILFNRGYTTDERARAFLNAEAGTNTDPLQMIGMQAAVDRILHALRERQPIAIYGDYDVDGVTATALLYSALRALGGDVQGYIPNRFEEGYGLNKDALDQLKAGGVKLVITVDCGIRSPDEAAHARTIGLDLIITDHHQPAEGELPPAVAVINPKQPGDTYPDKDMAGVGLAYKLVEALVANAPAPGEGGPWSMVDGLAIQSLLDLVALGTVADLAPLIGENRSLVRRGLRQMRANTRQGLFALANVADVSITKVNAGHIGFMLGPRLNASGRLESALASFELLTTPDVFRAGQLAQQLDVQNRQRQALTRQTQEQAEVLATSGGSDAFLLFAVHESFNPGVVGLAAARLMESHYRPAIVAATSGDETRGSCRSIPEFHITEALDTCADLLVRHGGHAAAAGFTVKNSNLPELVRRLQTLAAEKLGSLDLRPTVTADAEVPLTEMQPGLIKNLSYLEPTGFGNPDPAFVSRGVRVKTTRTVGAEGKHLKLVLEDELGFSHDAIGFRLGHLKAELPERVDLLYTYELNEYNGRVGYQLNLKDVRPAGTSD